MEQRLIDANALETTYIEGWGEAYSDLTIELAPTIDAVQVVHGRWEILEEANCVDTYGNPSKYAKCSFYLVLYRKPLKQPCLQGFSPCKALVFPCFFPHKKSTREKGLFFI